MIANSFALTLAALVALALTGLILIYRRESRQRRQLRAALFEPAYPLFQSYRVEQAGQDYPSLRGRYRERDFHIDLVVDTLTFRKIPVLWLRVSLLQPLPGLAMTDLLVRAQNNEFYAPANDLPYHLPSASHWPPGLNVKTEDPARAPSRDLLDAHMDFFASPEAKEVLLTPKGVRLVRMLGQGKRADYMVLRIADFPDAALDATTLADIMDRCIALAADTARELEQR
ncbi:hypothetical protein A8950_1597 [Dongia mobilis]|uniref:Uncharacterized protein n=1 Tax=Dongia mobilis TaxID=578943 RepID=A0A4R6WPY4_9PROT|nr:hypothetical protein [Dongia mobilis]TDQ83311.1 hypothetical protein A8950_1597 [Dongia mobilis]